jgi:hypothetical protein
MHKSPELINSANKPISTPTKKLILTKQRESPATESTVPLSAGFDSTHLTGAVASNKPVGMFLEDGEINEEDAHATSHQAKHTTKNRQLLSAKMNIKSKNALMDDDEDEIRQELEQINSPSRQHDKRDSLENSWNKQQAKDRKVPSTTCTKPLILNSNISSVGMKQNEEVSDPQLISANKRFKKAKKVDQEEEEAFTAIKNLSMKANNSEMVTVNQVSTNSNNNSLVEMDEPSNLNGSTNLPSSGSSIADHVQYSADGRPKLVVSIELDLLKIMNMNQHNPYEPFNSNNNSSQMSYEEHKTAHLNEQNEQINKLMNEEHNNSIMNNSTGNNNGSNVGNKMNGSVKTSPTLSSNQANAANVIMAPPVNNEVNKPVVNPLPNGNSSNNNNGNNHVSNSAPTAPVLATSNNNDNSNVDTKASINASVNSGSSKVSSSSTKNNNQVIFLVVLVLFAEFGQVFTHLLSERNDTFARKKMLRKFNKKIISYLSYILMFIENGIMTNNFKTKSSQ